MQDSFPWERPGKWALCLFLVAAAALCGCSGRERSPRPESKAEILRHFVVYEGPGEYCAWPSIGRTTQGDLIVLFTRTVEHLSPDGAIVLSRSTDEGETWFQPVTVCNTPIDDRESGLTCLSDGRILAYLWSTFHTPEFYAALAPGSYGTETLESWKRRVGSPEYRAAERFKGPWEMTSTDEGKSWSEPARGKDAVHGGIQLRDGSLLVASYREEEGGIGVHAAPSPEAPWERVATIASPLPDSLNLAEPHIVQLVSGRIIMMIRVTTKPYGDLDSRCVLWESYSDDGGRTWITPYPTELWGFPPHLALLADGRVLCTYGYRKPPYGERACISRDGVDWKVEDEVVLRDDAPNGDLGYPASVELGGGVILTVYYQPNVPRGTVERSQPPDPERRKPGILGTIWKVPRAAG